MITDLVGDEAAFRGAVRDWLARTVRPGWVAELAQADSSEFVRNQHWWMQQKQLVGLAAPHLPAEFGGCNLALAYQVIVAEEIAEARAPSSMLHTVSLNHVPATLLQWGSPAQKERYLPGIARGVVWCQAFSEPTAGSDLAALCARADRDGNTYVINGHKVWSSFSMYADYALLLARTELSERRHRGISYFILDMHAPGVEVKPIKQANGRAKFGEIFLTDVRVRAEHRVGEEGQGWAIAQSTLKAERGVFAFEVAERMRISLEDFYHSALECKASWLGDDELRRAFVANLATLQASRRLLRRLLKESEQELPESERTAVLVKTVNSTLLKDIARFMLQTQQIEGQRDRGGMDEILDDAMFRYIGAFGQTIGGGTNEIMRNIIAERHLGMPRL